jgi:antitoxin (DNA-binding transcriptional repressor) of toxin-antitoxin stability system
MTRKFSELRAKMAREARLESAEIAAALRLGLPLHQRQRELKARVSKDLGSASLRHESNALAGSHQGTCAAVENVATYLQSDMDASMTITTISSREFNQDTSRAKKAAQDGPVFITDRGRTAHVLITIEEYQRLCGPPMTLAEALAQPDVSDFEFDPPKIKGPLSKPVDLS